MARAYREPPSSPDPLRLSYDEWRAWYGATDLNRGEWVDGEVVPFMPPLVIHLRIAGFIYGLMMFYAQHKKLGDVFADGAELWLPKSQAARLPDICFIAREHADRLTAYRLEGYADLVVEIVSRDSVTRDRRQKFVEYQTAGIPEYWIVDPRPRSQTVTLYQLDDNGAYQAVAADEQGRLHSRVLPGFWIDPAWFWQDELPDPYQLLQTLLAEQPRP